MNGNIAKSSYNPIPKGTITINDSNNSYLIIF